MAREAAHILGPRLAGGIVSFAREGARSAPKVAAVRRGPSAAEPEKPGGRESALRGSPRGRSVGTWFSCCCRGERRASSCSPHRAFRLRTRSRPTDLLLRSGATIGEINTVRKHLSEVKGGGLLRRAAAARVVGVASRRRDRCVAGGGRLGTDGDGSDHVRGRPRRSRPPPNSRSGAEGGSSTPRARTARPAPRDLQTGGTARAKLRDRRQSPGAASGRGAGRGARLAQSDPHGVVARRHGTRRRDDSGRSCAAARFRRGGVCSREARRPSPCAAMAKEGETNISRWRLPGRSLASRGFVA